MARPRRMNDLPQNGAPDSILSAVPTAAELEARLSGLELEAARVRTLLSAVRQMSGSRQPIADLDDLAILEETA